ncbi:PREDICTED: cytochrome P450 714C2-like [Nicotiana attenuata]|uniref:Cytochrome p450 714c2 n=1 Tax=Nicotiana attenuata TaxID=49451 RepID=A0A1J6ISP7_NICAT|nr:PREDICTED: cytochrome P450 714C2-like [Nicotiana attenuata]OIT08229.1 cytochrome p450 714c2 [Nicotiana attenuata]
MEAEQLLMFSAKIILSLVLGGFLVFFAHLSNILILHPRKVRSKLQSQGIKGPPPSFLYGNLPDIKKIQLQNQKQPRPETNNQEIEGSSPLFHTWPAIVFSHIKQWQLEYGSTFMYSAGIIQTICTTDVEMVKEISLCTSLNLGKPSYLSNDRGPLLGQGIFSSNGTYWAHQRKIIAPEFYLNKVKEMVKLMVESTSKMIESWDEKIRNSEGKLEVKVEGDLKSLSADIISRACFGSNYAEGEQIFLKLQTLQRVMSKVPIGVPGLRHIPNKHNREIWRLEKEIKAMILKIVRARSNATCEKDLLKLILDAAKSYEESGDKLPAGITPDTFIVDNCKNIYFAGHETISLTASWCLMLLAAYPEWQARARAEVLDVCGSELPNNDMLKRMKVLTMIIHETLRLYPPVAFVVREALQDISFKDIEIPKGTNIQIHIPILHQQPELWGPDTDQFNPERFGKGIAKACKVPNAYIPFGIGSRTCAGQNLAMIELKVIVSMILSRFTFSLSPRYQHSPVFRLVIEPEHGVNLYLERI